MQFTVSADLPDLFLFFNFVELRRETRGRFLELPPPLVRPLIRPSLSSHAHHRGVSRVRRFILSGSSAMSGWENLGPICSRRRLVRERL
jgi:hypothetical protein